MSTLLLALRCACGTRPNWRILPAEREKYLDEPDEKVVGTWRCQGCGELHLVSAKAYKDARPTTRPAA